MYSSRALVRALVDEAEARLPDGGVFLELGCGDGRVCEAMRRRRGERGVVVGVDLRAWPGSPSAWSTVVESDAGNWLHVCEDVCDPSSDLYEAVEGADVVVCSLPLVLMKYRGRNLRDLAEVMRSSRGSVIGWTHEPFLPIRELGRFRTLRRWVPHLTPAKLWVLEV